MSPIKGLTDRPPRLPRIGKIHLGVKVTTNKLGQPCKPYPRATNYFVFDPSHPQLNELIATYGEKPTELRVLLPLEDETKFAQQFYRLYSQTRGLVCKGDGEEALRMIDTDTGGVAGRETEEVAMRTIPCQGRECPEYGPRACGETMNFQFILPEVSGFGVWQIDTGSINSIININSSIDLIRGVYGRISMVPLILALEPKEIVNPDDGKKKTVRVLNLRSLDKMIDAYRKSQLPPLELVAGMVERDMQTIEATDLPPAGDQPIYSDLPEASEVGPGTDTDPWPEATPGVARDGGPPALDSTVVPDSVQLPSEAIGPDVKEGILWISNKDSMPAGSKGMVIGIKETRDVLRWKVATDSSGSWVKDQPKEPWPGMVFNDLIDYVKAHKKTEGWLFKNFSFTVNQAKAKPYECALEVRQLMTWMG